MRVSIEIELVLGFGILQVFFVILWKCTLRSAGLFIAWLSLAYVTGALQIRYHHAREKRTRYLLPIAVQPHHKKQSAPYLFTLNSESIIHSCASLLFILIR